MKKQGRRSRGGWGALAPPPLRRMTFFCFVLVYGTYKEIKKGEQENESFLGIKCGYCY
jgi:hypothetical protein